MLFELFGLPVEKLIIFRSMTACLVAFALAIFLIPVSIFIQRLLSISENVELRSHPELDEELGKKKDTPTMGGIFIYITTLGGLITVSKVSEDPMLSLLVIVSIFFLIGLADDLTKYARKGRGLSLYSKLLLQLIASFFSAFILYHYMKASAGDYATSIYVPLAGFIDLGPAYVFVMLAYFIVFANGVNFADGLDGLAAGTFAITLLCYVVVSHVSGRADVAGYLGLPYVLPTSELTIFLMALMGALMGFLWFNFFPAQIFMGDSGALALGSVLVAVCAMTKTEFLAAAFGLIYVLEFMSSFVQVISFRLTGKRVLPIAPFHYIPRLRNHVHENKVILRIMMVHFLVCLGSFFFLKIR